MKKFLVVAVLAVPLIAFAKPSFKPGMWHMTVTMEMPGSPMQLPPMAFDRCLTAADAEKPSSVAKNPKDTDCEPADVKMDGTKMTYKIVCHKHGGTQTGIGEMTFSSESITGTMTMEMNNPRGGGVIKMIQHTSSTRTGDCAK